jgi:membrane dipeptidase
MRPFPFEVRAGRRRFLKRAAALAVAGPSAAVAAERIPIADAHSHYGLITRRLAGAGLADDMRRNRVALVAWKVVADRRWIRATATGIEQSSEPGPGDLARYFAAAFEEIRTHATGNGLRIVRTPADVDACVAGEPGVVLASEGADFLEGNVDALGPAVDLGLRHLQLVHYIRTPVGDFQTVAPVHQGLSAMGRSLVEACNARGVLVDLAHATAPAVEQALAISTAPMIWSHGWVDGDGGHWQDRYGYLKRRLSVALAKKIAGRGGVVGLWGLGLSRPGPGWPVASRDTQAYARELARLVDVIGADHVVFGTDIEGVGSNWVVNDYGHVRTVVEHLDAMKLPAGVVERVAYRNYARVLKAVLRTG